MEITENKLKEILIDQRKEYQHDLHEQRKEFQHVVGIFKEDLQSQIQVIGEQYGPIMENIEIIKSDIQFIKGSLKKKVDYDEFEALARRVALLESKSKK